MTEQSAIVRKVVRIRTSGQLNTGSPRSTAVVTTVKDDEILVIETVSLSLRVPLPAQIPDVVRFALTTGAEFPPGTGSPLLDIPVARTGVDPAGQLVNYVALAHMRAYATAGIVQYSIDLSVPCAGAFDVSVFGYLIPATSPSLAP